MISTKTTSHSRFKTSKLSEKCVNEKLLLSVMRQDKTTGELFETIITKLNVKKNIK